MFNDKRIKELDHKVWCLERIIDCLLRELKLTARKESRRVRRRSGSYWCIRNEEELKKELECTKERMNIQSGYVKEE